MDKQNKDKTLLGRQKLVIIILAVLAVVMAAVYVTYKLTVREEMQTAPVFYKDGRFFNDRGDAVELYIVDTAESKSLTSDIAAMLSGKKKNELHAKSTDKGIVFYKDNVSINSFPYIFPEIQKQDLARIIVTNIHGTYSVYNSGGDFFIEGAEENLYNSQLLSQLILQARYMLSNGYVENANDPSEYSVTPENFVARVSVYDNDGNNYTVFIGDRAVNNNQVYMKLDGKDDIYIMDNTADVFLENVRSFLSPLVVKPIEEQQRNYLDAFALVKNDVPFFACELIPEDMRTGVYINQIHKMTYPEVEFVLDTMNVYEMFSSVAGLAGEYVEEFGVSKSPDKDAILEFYGLSSPTAEIGYSYGQNSYLITVGRRADTVYYVYSHYQDTIVAVPAASLAFLDYDISDFYQSQVFQYSINEIEEIEVKTGENVYLFSLRGEGEGLKVSEKNKSLEIDTPSFRQFYISLLSVSIGGYSSIEGASADTLKHELTFTVKLRNGAKLTYDFYSESTTSCYMIVDGKGGFKTDRSRIEKIATYADMLVNGEKIESVI